MTAVLAATAWVAADWWLGARSAPGAGQAYQEAPDRVGFGQAVRVTLRLGVWGAGGPATKRYANVQLHLQSASSPDAMVLAPSVSELDGGQMVYRFDFQAPPAPVDQIRYWFTFVFDGQSKRVEGIKPILLGQLIYRPISRATAAPSSITAIA